ncbi:hypothetical protein, partial [Rhodopirellula sallentina]|uniref:hypothetical protein n=1 Tax=Rhodopirellula sallentina TaxID=1263869 RepID=UPI0005C7E1E3
MTRSSNARTRQQPQLSWVHASETFIYRIVIRQTNARRTDVSEYRPHTFHNSVIPPRKPHEIPGSRDRPRPQSRAETHLATKRHPATAIKVQSMRILG